MGGGNECACWRIRAGCLLSSRVFRLHKVLCSLVSRAVKARRRKLDVACMNRKERGCK
jgi:hypothetical protein